MLQAVDHIGIAVSSLQKIKDKYRRLFSIEPTVEEVVEEQGVRVACYQLGDTRLEFLEPITETSPIRKYIDKRGEGLHHIALRVDDINSTLGDIKEDGLRLIDQEPRLGADNMNIAFAHPKDFDGILIEFCQKAQAEEG